MTALVNALPALRAGTLWADLNTASPRVKEALVERLASRDVPVVDVALMSPVPGRGPAHADAGVRGGRPTATPRSSPASAPTVTVQPGPPGTAISRKLLRSVFYKGLAAAVVEALRGRRGRRLRRLAARQHRRRAGRLRRAAPSTGSSTARTGTPGAAPTRWPPPPSS